MTCDHCAVKVEAVLEDAGAQGVFVDYRRGFAEFESEGVDFEQARAFLRDTSYELGEPLDRGRRQPEVARCGHGRGVGRVRVRPGDRRPPLAGVG